ncbi:hypothetical protein GGF32_005841 [Allomyces javanicus]|nr:hypothetical protein GGF32_005841 [Allomyces javanicus]
MPPQLVSLHLERCHLSPKDLNVLAGSWPSSLRHLNLENNYFTNGAPVGLPAKLRTLVLARNYSWSAGKDVSWVHALPPSLRVLDLVRVDRANRKVVDALLARDGSRKMQVHVAKSGTSKIARGSRSSTM